MCIGMHVCVYACMCVCMYVSYCVKLVFLLFACLGSTPRIRVLSLKSNNNQNKSKTWGSPSLCSCWLPVGLYLGGGPCVVSPPSMLACQLGVCRSYTGRQEYYQEFMGATSCHIQKKLTQQSSRSSGSSKLYATSSVMLAELWCRWCVLLSYLGLGTPDMYFFAFAQ